MAGGRSSQPYRFGGDSYRPAPSFDFRAPGPQRSFANRDEPRNPPSRRTRPERRSYRDKQGANNNDSSRFRGRDRKPRSRPADRPLLQAHSADRPERMIEINNSAQKFKDFAELSDSDEQSMQFSASDNSDYEEPVRKKIATGKTSNKKPIELNEQPKWSNPDPYTSLPPPESQGKRKDFVRLIRKARASTAKEHLSLAANEDFISFEKDETEEAQNVEKDDFPKPPTGPKSTRSNFSHLDNLHPDRRVANNNRTQPKHDQSPSALTNSSTSGRIKLDSWPPPPRPRSPPRRTIFDDDEETSGGVKNPKSRKRGRDTEQMPRSSRPNFSDIIMEWRPIQGQNAVPWCTMDYGDIQDAHRALHKEITDFYDWARPQKHENEIRHDLVSRVSNSLKIAYPDFEVRYFGSFAAGLYLPTADMDLVVVSKSFLAGKGSNFVQTFAALRKFGRALQNAGLVKAETLAIIPKAKVPLVKYVDRKTNIRVDISFENTTGLVANGTYNDWRAQHPAMPSLVALVKQFLAMRGFNDVSVGGLGGFSVSCLVVSLLQQLPGYKPIDPIENLGEVFLHFLDFYGNKFNLSETGIQLNPPALFSKRHNTTLVGQKGSRENKLCIIDPNKPTNDISGGSRHAVIIFRCFSHAYTTLTNAIAAAQQGKGSRSLLGAIFAGNYSTFERQREYMQQV